MGAGVCMCLRVLVINTVQKSRAEIFPNVVTSSKLSCLIYFFFLLLMYILQIDSAFGFLLRKYFLLYKILLTLNEYIFK